MWRNRGCSFLVSGLAGFLMIGLPAAAVELPKRFEFGRIPLASSVDRLPRWAVKDNCRRPNIGLSSCTFSDPEGILYHMVDGYVCTKEIYVNAKTRHRLPYGIRFGSSKSEIVAYMSKKLKLKFSEAEDRTVSSELLSPKIEGSSIDLRFDRNNRLASIELWSLCT